MKLVASFGVKHGVDLVIKKKKCEYCKYKYVGDIAGWVTASETGGMGRNCKEGGVAE